MLFVPARQGSQRVGRAKVSREAHEKRLLRRPLALGEFSFVEPVGTRISRFTSAPSRTYDRRKERAIVGAVDRIRVPLAVLLLSATVAAGQQTPVRSDQRFRSGVEVVTLDVSVLGRDRRPVRGLTAADFVVIEDGVEQAIETFSEVALPARVPAPAAWWTSVAEDMKTSTAIDSGRLLLVVIDDAHIRAEHVYVTKRIASQIVDRMAPGDRMAVIYTRMNGSSQDFTDEPRLIREAIDRFTPGGEAIRFGSSPSRPSGSLDEGSREPAATAFAAMPGSDCGYCTRQTLDTLENIGKNAAALPGRRKALFLIGELGVPTPSGPCFMDALDIFREASRANVNIYPISPSAMEDGFDIGASTADEAAAAREQARDLRDGLRALADNTGGFAIVNTNEFERGIEQVYAENESYYLLGYATSSTRDRRKFRDIQVTVRRPGLQVRARDGYVPAKPAKAEGVAPEPVRAAISGLLPSSDLVMSATVVPMKGASRDRRTALAAVIEVRPPVGADPVEDVLSVEAVVVDANGTARDRVQVKVPIRITPRPGVTAAYRVPFVLHASPGRHQLRFGVASRSAGKAGSIYYDLDVPKYGEDPVELSGLALFARVDAPSVKPDVLAPGLPITPSLRRSFGGGEAVRAAARVYAQRGAAPVAVVARLDGAGGDEVWRQALEPLSPDAAGTLAVFDLPMPDLAPGPYRLTITASLGATTASRVTRFIVR